LNNDFIRTFLDIGLDEGTTTAASGLGFAVVGAIVYLLLS
jgi:RsiW-degrading membrane proteinase PrsW (M82 family)